MTTRPSKRIFLIGLAAAAALASGLAAAQATTPVTVQAGFIPVIDVAALYLGDEMGIWKKHGIEL